jgi:hypothetical protein
MKLQLLSIRMQCMAVIQDPVLCRIALALMAYRLQTDELVQFEVDSNCNWNWQNYGRTICQLNSRPIILPCVHRLNVEYPVPLICGAAEDYQGACRLF